jgi:predicted RNA-binding Zn ribbon-like protein
MSRSKSAKTFRLGLGHTVLELLATLAGRHREPIERLAEPKDLTRWLMLTGLADEARCTTDHLARAQELREAIYRVVQAARTGGRPATRDISLVNRWASQPRAVPQLDAAFGVRQRCADPCAAALAELAAAAIELISGPDLARIRNCADPTCSLMFIDRSRPGSRRWCSMERCGNRAKTTRYRRHPARTR